MGSRGNRQTTTQINLERRQTAELDKLKATEASQKLAAGRKSRGRASLISGDEAGIGGDPAFAQKNLATKEKIGVEKAALAETVAAEKAKKAKLIQASLLQQAT